VPSDLAVIHFTARKSALACVLIFPAGDRFLIAVFSP
jgi:hypothetical protein